LSKLFEDKFKEDENEGDVTQTTIDSLKLKKEESFIY